MGELTELAHSVSTAMQAEMAAAGWGGGGGGCPNAKQQNALIFKAAGSVFPDHDGRRTRWCCPAVNVEQTPHRKARAWNPRSLPRHAPQYLTSCSKREPQNGPCVHCSPVTSQEPLHVTGEPEVLRDGQTCPREVGLKQAGQQSH